MAVENLNVHTSVLGWKEYKMVEVWVSRLQVVVTRTQSASVVHDACLTMF